MKNKGRHFVIGTAGHIDHGKTALVKNLTGKDTDWLKEEKERGMTIDLGFAFLGDNITIIDVPGHERFIRNMVAGVTTIDLVLFIVAADDGVMPQTREHLEILNLLQIQQGIIVITKIDLVEPEWVELVIDDVKQLIKGSFLENAPIVQVSNENGKGIDEVKQMIFKRIDTAGERKDKGVFRMPIDRIFTMKGFGTIVAGTVLSGSLTSDDMVELLPQRNKLRVRGLQMHGQKVDRVKIGDRAAVNLIGIEKNAITRGNVLAEPDFYCPTKYFDAKFYLLKSSPRNLKHTARIRTHVGTSEILGRVSILDRDEIMPGETSYVQFRMEKPIVADIDDRFVVRSYSPIVTIGGGRILDVHPKRHKRFSSMTLEKLSSIESGDLQTLIEQYLIDKKFTTYSISRISQALSISKREVVQLLKKMISENIIHSVQQKGQSLYLHQKFYERAKQELINTLKDFHFKNPTKKGVNKTDLKVLMNISIDQIILNKILDELIAQKQVIIFDNKVALATHKLKISAKQIELMEHVAQTYLDEKFTTSSFSGIAAKLNYTQQEIIEAVEILIELNTLIKVDENIIFHHDNIKKAKKLIIEYFRNNKELTVGDCRQILNTSRKYTVPLLNHFDRIGLTVRQQDIRVLNTDYEDF